MAENAIRWSSTGAEQVKRDYASIDQSQARLNASYTKSATVARTAAGEISQLGRATREYAQHATVAATASNNVSVGMAGFARAAGAAALLELGRRGVMAADAYKGVQNQLRVAGIEANNLAAATDRLFEVSNKTNTAVEANSVLYGRLSAAQKELGATSEQLFTFTEAVGNALLINNTEASAATGALLQLSQAMGGANIQAQEFNSLVDGMRPLLAAAAKYIEGAGGSVSKLKQLVNDGEVSSREFFDAVLLGAKDLEAQAAKAVTRTGQELVVLRNEFIQAAGESQAFTAASNLSADAVAVLAGSVGTLVGEVDKAAQPFLYVGRAMAAMYKDVTALEDSVPGVDLFFEAVKNGAQATLNPMGYLVDEFGKLRKLLVDDQKEWYNGGSERQWRGSYGSAAQRLNDKYGGSIPLPSEKPSVPEEFVARRRREAEKAARDAKKAQEELNRAYEDEMDILEAREQDYIDELKADRERTDAREAYQKSLDDELRMLGMTDRARALEIERLRAEQEAVGLAGDARRKYVEQAVAKRGEIFDREEAARDAKAAAEEVRRVWLRAADDVKDAWSDFLFDIFDKGKISFKSFARDLRSIWARTLADLIAQSSQNSVVAPLFQAMFGLGAGAPGTGASGTRQAFQQAGMGSLEDLLKGGLTVANDNDPGAGAVQNRLEQSIFGPLKKGIDSIFGAGSGQMLGQLFGSAMAGMAIGQMVGSGTGGAIGGTIGQMVGGPIGQLVGSIIGGIVGSLFKSTPRSIASVTTSGAGLAAVDSVLAIGLDEKIGRSMGDSVARALNEYADLLDSTLQSDAFLGMVGQRGKKFFFQSRQSDIKKAGKKSYGAVKFETAEEAIAAAIEAAIDGGILQGLSDVDRRLIDAAASVEQGIADAVKGREFRRELELQFMALGDPLGAAIARINDEYAEQVKLAEKYGADVTLLEAIYARKRLDAEKQYQEQSLGGLRDYLAALTGGSSSPLPATTRLGVAQTRFLDLRARALTGDQDAIEALQGVSEDMLDAARDLFGSGRNYFDRLDLVIATLTELAGTPAPAGTVGGIGVPSIAALNQQIAAVNDNAQVQLLLTQRAEAQRNDQLDLLRSIDARLGQLTGSALRASASGATQSGTAKVGSW